MELNATPHSLVESPYYVLFAVEAWGHVRLGVLKGVNSHTGTNR